jgi:frataxin
LCRRAFSADVTGTSSLPESEFSEIADSTLDAIEVAAGSLDDILEKIDVTNAMGVLTLALGDGKGTYVINKQAPNRQLWWSSPVSGPRRYAWDAASGRWRNTRDGHDMLEALVGEIKALTGVALEIKPPARGGGAAAAA